MQPELFVTLLIWRKVLKAKFFWASAHTRAKVDGDTFGHCCAARERTRKRAFAAFLAAVHQLGVIVQSSNPKWANRPSNLPWYVRGKRPVEVGHPTRQ